MTWPTLLQSKRCKPLTRAEERVMLDRYHQGDRRAGDRLVESNLKFVAAVARKYLGRGLSFDDLMAEGAIGMQIAVQKFDPASPLRLVSYAVWWIRQKMIMALAEHSKVVKMPPRFLDLAKKMERARAKLEQASNRPATIEEIAEAMGIRPEDIAVALPALTPSASIHFETADGATLEDMLPSDSQADDWAAAGMLERYADKVSAHLTPDEKAIWRGCYGLDGEVETLESLGQQRGLTREGVRLKRKNIRRRVEKRAKALGGML